MSANFDEGSLLSGAVRELVKGQETQDVYIAREICTPYAVDDAEGTIPYEDDADSLSRDDAGSATGASLTYFDDKLSSETYKLRPYAKGFHVQKHVLAQLERYSAYLTRRGNKCRAHVYTSIDRTLETLLTDTTATVNNSGPVNNGTWDVSTSTPFQDMEDMVESVPGIRGPDGLLVIGYQQERRLRVHEDVTARVANYASGTMIGNALLASILREALGIPNIMIANKIYNSASAGIAVSTSRVLDDVCFGGIKSSLLRVHLSGFDEGDFESAYDFDQKQWAVSFDHPTQIKRVNANHGFVLTGTI